MVPMPHSDTFYDALAAMAEELRHTIIALVEEERLPFVQRRVVNSEIVFGVWPDPEGTAGFGFHLIKGRGHLAALSAGLPEASTTTAIPCVGLEQALAAERLWGEPDPKQNRSSVSTNGKRKKAMPQSKEAQTTKAPSSRPKRARRTRH